jgi:hypothetical protein
MYIPIRKGANPSFRLTNSGLVDLTVYQYLHVQMVTNTCYSPSLWDKLIRIYITFRSWNIYLVSLPFTGKIAFWET